MDAHCQVQKQSYCSDSNSIYKTGKRNSARSLFKEGNLFNKELPSQSLFKNLLCHCSWLLGALSLTSIKCLLPFKRYRSNRTTSESVCKSKDSHELVHFLCAGSYTERPAWWRFRLRLHRFHTWRRKLRHRSLTHSWSPVSGHLTSDSGNLPLPKHTQTHAHTDVKSNGKLSIHYMLINWMSSGHWSLSDV